MNRPHCDERRGKQQCGRYAVAAHLGVVLQDGAHPVMYRCERCPPPVPSVVKLAVTELPLCNCGNVATWSYVNDGHILARCDSHREPSILTVVEQLVTVQRHSLRDEVDLQVGRLERHRKHCRRCVKFQPCPERAEMEGRLSLLAAEEIKLNGDTDE